jgi:predicted PolB exonuclease-like 3'-5' exonuclease
MNFQVSVGNQDQFYVHETFDTTKELSGTEYLNYKNTLIISSDSDFIRVPINLDDSYIKINNVNRMNDQDTIRISRLRLIDCRERDTSFVTKQYFNLLDSKRNEFEEIASEIHGKREVFSKNCKEEFPEQINLLINNERHVIELEKVYIGETTSTGNGYTRKRKMNGQFRKNTRKIYISRTTKEYGKIGETEL